MERKEEAFFSVVRGKFDVFCPERRLKWWLEVEKLGRSMGISSPCVLPHHRTSGSAYGGSVL